jgi:hypothetical protein
VVATPLGHSLLCRLPYRFHPHLRLYGVGVFVTEIATRMNARGSGAASGSAICCTNVAGSRNRRRRHVLPYHVRALASLHVVKATAVADPRIPLEAVCRHLVGRRRDRLRNRLGNGVGALAVQGEEIARSGGEEERERLCRD